MDARRWLTLGSVFCMLVLLSNCNQDTTVFGPQDTKAFASGFAGRVVDRKGKGVSGALVTALPGGVTTVSGDSGRFELGNLASGTYRLSLSKVDYRDTSVGDSVALGLRETKSLLPQALQYRYGSIRGKVLDSSGAPQISAGVVVQEQDASTFAVDGGNFQLSRVEPGRIKLFSAMSGYGYGTREVELRADSMVEVELRIDHKGGTVTGKVTKDDGLTPLAGATVSAVGGALHTVTKDDGSYSLGQVPQTASITIVSGDQKAQVNGVQVAEGGRASLPDLHLSQVPTGALPALLNGMSLGVTTDSVVTLVAADTMGSDTSWHVRRYLWSLDAGRTWDSTFTGVLRLHPAQLGWAEGLHRVKVRMRLYRTLGISVLDSTSAVATIDVRLLPPPDIIPPHLARVSPLKDTTYLAWLDSMATVEWKVTDDRRLDTAILDDLPGSQQGSHLLKSYSFPVGVTTVRAWARDSAGNEARDSVVFVRSHKPARDSSLSLLVVGLDTIHSTLVPAFASGRLDYVDTVSATDSVVWVRAFAKDTAGTVVTIAGTASRTKSVKLNAAGSSTPIRVVVRAGDGDTLAYVVDVFRRAATTSDSSIPWNNAIAYGTLLDSRDGKSYRTVKIGTQTWMAENLNFGSFITTNGNQANDAKVEKFCYDNDSLKCSNHRGGLYQWAEAMSLPSSCGTASCSDRISKSKYRGICPENWHIPSSSEWNELANKLGGNQIAGASMKSWQLDDRMWDSAKYNDGNSTGFSALSVGYWHGIDKKFNDSGIVSAFWDANEEDASHSARHFLNASSTSFYPTDGYTSKLTAFSLRCIQDNPDTLTTLHALTIDSGLLNSSFDSTVSSYTDSVSSSVTSLHIMATASSASDTVKINGVVVTSGVATLVNVPTDTTITIVVSNPNTTTKRTYTVRVAHKVAVVTTIPWNSSIAYGTLLDSRDGKSYRTVKIGTQTWMAENLNYRNTTGSADTVGVCYNNNADSCAKYGRLYTWNGVMGGASSTATSPSNVQGICPTGWHVPSDGEWDTLIAAVGGSSNGGVILKSMNGWSANTGTDLYGFRALPGGFFGASFGSAGIHGNWWSATPLTDSSAWHRNMDWYYATVYHYVNNKTFGISLRCVQDLPDTLITLHRIVFDSGSLSPVFDSNVTAYTDTVSSTVSSFNVSASPSSSNATLTINGSQVTSGAAVTVLVPKDTTITFVVANGSRARTYTVRVVHRIATRAGNNLTAAALGLDASWNQTISTYDTFTDTRDGHLYRSVKIGNQVWMAENLNFSGTATVVGVCYNNLSSNCNTYGRLYAWSDLLQGSSPSNLVPSGVEGVCPVNWHIPSDSEWTVLQYSVDSSNAIFGKLLKATVGWNDPAGVGIGVDRFGFRILSAGYSVDYGTFMNNGTNAIFWSATSYDASNSWIRHTHETISGIGRYYLTFAPNRFSVRCVLN